jgi:DNA repair protein RecO (recombination protein O)
MRSRNVDALVLKSINFRDTDKIYTVISKELGKISVKARGIRKINSKRLSSLDTLNYVRIGVVGDGALKTITESKLIHSFSNLKRDLDKLNTAYYFIEIINKIVHESEEDSYIFELLSKCLKRLDEVSYNDSRVENYFELKLLEYLGYSLSLEKCLQCEETLNPQRDYYFDYEGVGLVCFNCQHSSFPLKKLTLNSILYLKGYYLGNELDFTDLDLILKYYINDLIGGVSKSKKYLDVRNSK